MRNCPLTYEPLSGGRYAPQGFRRLSGALEDLADFPYSAAEQLEEARMRASKLSIQGVHPKLSAVLSVKQSTFVLVDRGGRYILKPQNPGWPQVPEVEDLTVRLAGEAGIEVPLHGLIYCRDGSLTYFIRRFDRTEPRVRPGQHNDSPEGPDGGVGASPGRREVRTDPEGLLRLLRPAAAGADRQCRPRSRGDVGPVTALLG